MRTSRVEFSLSRWPGWRCRARTGCRLRCARAPPPRLRPGAARGAGVRMREHPTVGIDGQPAADASVSLLEEGAAFSGLADAEFLGL
ncbi:hypothetical protein G6F68_020939 [Rhizopus microsporus]|nr:hypothetical protein G6F68_020939 [Rhizopus microsporus]